MRDKVQVVMNIMALIGASCFRKSSMCSETSKNNDDKDQKDDGKEEGSKKLFNYVKINGSLMPGIWVEKIF